LLPATSKAILRSRGKGFEKVPRAHSAGFLLNSVTRETRRGTAIDPTIPALRLRTAEAVDLQVVDVRDKGFYGEAIYYCNLVGLGEGAQATGILRAPSMVVTGELF
jgi:hypothetical protein